MTQDRTLVTGATGKTGRRVVHRLAELGVPVRGVSRSSTPRFDWQDPATWPDVFRDVRAAYLTYYPDLNAPAAPDTIRAVAAAAAGAGVQRLVLLSGRGEPNAQRCEEIIRESGLEYTLIRASWFAQNFTEGHLLDSVRSGVVAMPAGTVSEPFVDADDIADVAVAALTEDRHAGRLYEVTGPRLLTFADAAAEMAKATGRDIEYVPITLEQFHAALAASVGPEFAGLLTDLCRQVLDGRNESVTHGVREALGREPRDFTDFCRAAAASGAWS